MGKVESIGVDLQGWRGDQVSVLGGGGREAHGGPCLPGRRSPQLLLWL